MKQWWKPKNDHGRGFVGVFHTMANIVTESLRRALNFIHLNPEVKGHDLAYWLAHAIFIIFAIYLLYAILSGGQVMDVIK